jgi:DNA N-6-adenine-methyltransferase (Dam)
MHNTVVPRSDDGELTLFEPQKTRPKLALLKEGVRTAARIRDWEALGKAVDAIIKEQKEFEAWWRANVTPGKAEAGPGRGKKGVSERGHLLVADATKQTGVTKQQVSKWKRHLGDEASYRTDLRESAYIPMWARREGSQLNQQSLSAEHYTPFQYLDAARLVLGSIDLDPASCRDANEIVQAENFFTKKDDGLTKPWHGRVWLNPPYGRLPGAFVSKFIDEFAVQRVTAGILLVNAHCTDTEWFQPLWNGVLCFTDHRINFYGDDDRSGSTHGSVFAYFGPDEAKFAEVFKQFGARSNCTPQRATASRGSAERFSAIT